jgi:hypothetical protein
MFTKDEALQVIAERIWKNGEVEKQTLVPSDVNNSKSLYGKASDVLEKYFTHYDLMWLERGKTVLIKTYMCKGLGAVDVTANDIAQEYTVKVG